MGFEARKNPAAVAAKMPAPAGANMRLTAQKGI